MLKKIGWISVCICCANACFQMVSAKPSNTFGNISSLKLSLKWEEGVKMPWKQHPKCDICSAVKSNQFCGIISILSDIKLSINKHKATICIWGGAAIKWDIVLINTSYPVISMFYTSFALSLFYCHLLGAVVGEKNKERMEKIFSNCSEESPLELNPQEAINYDK